MRRKKGGPHDLSSEIVVLGVRTEMSVFIDVVERHQCFHSDWGCPFSCLKLKGKEEGRVNESFESKYFMFNIFHLKSSARTP